MNDLEAITVALLNIVGTFVSFLIFAMALFGFGWMIILCPILGIILFMVITGQVLYLYSV